MRIKKLKLLHIKDMDYEWVKVPIKVLRELDILKDISKDSYINPDRKHIWLDQDNDISLFFDAIHGSNEYDIDIKHYEVEELSLIRTFDNVNEDFLWRAQRDLSM